ncbi:MAG: antitoxin [Candidatus Omnitrophica bacterium]|nr:antitoxin [Candidatus Omnitrophota bacterium]MBU0896101.1 antitoxin [Candidatus Omnitrophota bacterium]MBU1367210.1 antitoxin [Candidatus Omnitrophota bacterium]MBU1524035.1 antitoxin [Candidatus Omnitrophota bacterium]MBU1809610.1 antitoxin [Candidatus Omnitrophota bacterium]
MKIKGEDKEILEAYEGGAFKSVPNVKKEVVRYREYAKSTLRKNKRINIRMSESDIVHIQRKAVENGLPYQTLISSILHKYANGNVVEKPV